MPDFAHPKPTLHKRAGGILSLSGPALLDLLQAVLRKRAPFRFTARGCSMSPFVKNGDVITVSPHAVNAIRLGDVVAFVNPCCEKLTVHRVIAVAQDAWLVKGDNTPEPDGWISHARILGHVTRVERARRNMRLGLGFDRVIIASLSRRGWLVPLMWTTRRVMRPIVTLWQNRA